MERSKELLKNTIILFLGSFLPKLTIIITLPILTLKMTKVDYGTYDLIITLVSLLLPATTLQIQSAAFRFLIDYRNDEKKQKEIITSIIVFVIMISLCILTILFFCLRKQKMYIRIIITIYYLFDIILIVLQQIIRGLGKNILYTITSIVTSVVSTILIGVALIGLNLGLFGAICSLAIATFVGIIIVLFSGIKKKFDIKYFSWKQIKKMLAYSWPMVPNNLSGWILSLSDRIVITMFIGLEANAIYAVANKIPNLLTTAKSTFNFAWQENASLALNDDNKDIYYNKVFDDVLRIFLGIMAILIGVSPYLFYILIKGDYEDAYIQMLILFFGMFFSCIASFIGGIYIAHMKTKSVGITTIIAAVCNLLIDLLLIKKIGIYAGSISTLFSYLFLMIYRMIDVQKFQKIKIDLKLFLLSLSFLIIMTIICFMQNIVWNVINLIIGIVFAYYLNNKVINKTFLKIRSKGWKKVE